MRKIHMTFVLLLILETLQSGCGLVAPSHHQIADYTPVFAAAAAGDLEAITLAVRKDHVVIAAREWDEATLLHVTVQQNHKELATFLLDQGADVNATTKEQLTPLHMAAQNGNADIVQLLLDRNANIDAVDAKGWTPLDRAIKWRHPTVADLLAALGGHGMTSDGPHD